MTTGFLLELGRVIRSFFKHNTTISGEILCNGKGDKCNRPEMSMTLRIQGEINQSLEFKKNNPQSDEDYFLVVAEKTLAVLDPVQVIAWHYATANDKALSEVANTMIGSTHAERHWAFLFLGHLDQHAGSCNSALYQYDRTLEIKPDFLEAHSEIAVVRNSIGELDKAEIAVKKALTIDPNHVSTLTTSAFIYIAKGDYTAAVSLATRAIDIDETTAYSRVALGQAHSYNEDYDNSLLSMRNGLEKMSKSLTAGYIKEDPESEQLLATFVSIIALSLEKLHCHMHSAMAYDIALDIFDRPSDVLDQLKSKKEAALKRHMEALKNENVQCVDGPV